MPDYYKSLCEIAKRQDKALEQARAAIRKLHSFTDWNDYALRKLHSFTDWDDYAKNSPEMKLIDAARKEWLQFNAIGN